MMNNEIKMIVGYKTIDAENNTRVLSSDWLCLSNYDSWGEIEDELQNHGIDSYDGEWMLLDVENLPGYDKRWNDWDPERLFNLIKDSEILEDSYKFDIMEAYVEVRSLDDFANLVDSKWRNWDEDINLYEGFTWCDYGRMVYKNYGYKIPTEIENCIDFEKFGKSFEGAYSAYEYSNGIIEVAY